MRVIETEANLRKQERGSRFPLAQGKFRETIWRQAQPVAANQKRKHGLVWQFAHPWSERGAGEAERERTQPLQTKPKVVVRSKCSWRRSVHGYWIYQITLRKFVLY